MQLTTTIISRASHSNSCKLVFLTYFMLIFIPAALQHRYTWNPNSTCAHLSRGFFATPQCARSGHKQRCEGQHGLRKRAWRYWKGLVVDGFNPFKQYLCQIGIISQGRGENKKIFEPPLLALFMDNDTFVRWSILYSLVFSFFFWGLDSGLLFFDHFCQQKMGGTRQSWLEMHSWLVVQPLWKIWSSKWVHLPQIGMTIKKYLKPPPR